MRKLSIFLLITLVFTLFACLAEANDAGNCLIQTWQGTIGKVPIMMQFESGEQDDILTGRYYYRTSFADLILLQDETSPDRWKELDSQGKISGYLRLTCAGNTLKGTWFLPDGTKTLPVIAERRQAGTYSQYRLDNMKTTGPGNTIGRFSYVKYTAQGFDSVGGLRLTGKVKEITGINSALRAIFTDRLAEGIECINAGRMRRDGDFKYEYKYDIDMIAWNKAFVVIGESMSQYCGGMHPEVWEKATTYSLRSGKVERMPRWLTDSYREKIPNNSPLGKIILENYRGYDIQIYPTRDSGDENECLATLEFFSDNMWPTSTGMVFRPAAPYAQSACIVNVTIPYKKLSPYLSREGKANIMAFQSR